MPARPNFTDAQLVNGKVRVEGRSDDDISDLVDIRVVLVQGDRIGAASVEQISAVWNVQVEASTAFDRGDAVAFGVETRSQNFLTMSWTEPVTIR
jgi:hypothetical protein